MQKDTKSHVGHDSITNASILNNFDPRGSCVSTWVILPFHVEERERSALLQLLLLCQLLIEP